mmetsp:Transcript_28413/g.46510  ORF Transcript_28413/g.46510 Transcript_28413/m.46510 type:complete len:208 (+) Transcript_28413:715-1338(+)
MDANRGTSGDAAVGGVISMSKIFAYSNTMLLNFNLVIGFSERSDGDLIDAPGDCNTWEYHLMKSPVARNMLASKYKSMAVFAEPPAEKESAAYPVALSAAASSSSQLPLSRGEGAVATSAKIDACNLYAASFITEEVMVGSSRNCFPPVVNSRHSKSSHHFSKFCILSDDGFGSTHAPLLDEGSDNADDGWLGRAVSRRLAMWSAMI